jgi:hypothetical protein
MPGGGPQTDTIAITQGHLPYNAESPPAAPIADSERKPERERVTEECARI